MEPLPKGANFIRGKFLWEIGLHIAGNPATPYYGNRDLCITIGSGSAASYRPWLRMSTGSPILAHAVARSELDLAIVNPSAMLTQAYRGKGLFREPLRLRIVANYPSWDRFAYVLHPRTGIGSLAEIKARRFPLRLSTREDPTHSTRNLIDQTLAIHGFSTSELASWGGSLQLNGGPGDQRRMDALAAGTIYACFDYSGWPLYSRADLPDDDAYKVCDAIHAREAEIVWEDTNGWAPHAGMGPLGQETEATPRDVPLHPGAARWFRE